MSIHGDIILFMCVDGDYIDSLLAAVEAIGGTRVRRLPLLPLYDSNYSFPVRICSAIQFSFITHPGCVQMMGGIANYDQFRCCLVSYSRNQVGDHGG